MSPSKSVTLKRRGDTSAWHIEFIKNPHSLNFKKGDMVMKTGTRKQGIIWGGLLILFGIMALVETYTDLGPWVWVIVLAAAGLLAFVVFITDRGDYGRRWQRSCRSGGTECAVHCRVVPTSYPCAPRHACTLDTAARNSPICAWSGCHGRHRLASQRSNAGIQRRDRCPAGHDPSIRGRSYAGYARSADQHRRRTPTGPIDCAGCS